jgi:GMP synthase-like glutamine amidotransferase
MISIIDMNYKKDSLGFYEFVLPIITIVKNIQECEAKHYSEVGQTDTRDSTGIILSGTALRDNETLEHVEDFAWIRECEKPILGICAGMQAIGLVFNSTLTECLEIGMKQITTTKENPLFSSSFRAYELHTYSINPSKDFNTLAESERCIQAIRHKEKNIYGVLFHPEVRNQEIIKRFLLLSKPKQE